MQVVRAVLAFPLRILGQNMFMLGIFALAAASRISGVDYVQSLYTVIADIARSDSAGPLPLSETHQKEVI